MYWREKISHCFSLFLSIDGSVKRDSSHDWERRLSCSRWVKERERESLSWVGGRGGGRRYPSHPIQTEELMFAELTGNESSSFELVEIMATSDGQTSKVFNEQKRGNIKREWTNEWIDQWLEKNTETVLILYRCSEKSVNVNRICKEMTLWWNCFFRKKKTEHSIWKLGRSGKSWSRFESEESFQKLQERALDKGEYPVSIQSLWKNLSEDEGTPKNRFVLRRKGQGVKNQGGTR